MSVNAPFQTKMPEIFENYYIPTLNQTGFMTLEVDEYSQEFIKYSASFPDVPSLEIGATYGVATLKALSKGAHIIANDIDNRHLEILKQNCPENCKDWLTLLPRSFPEAFDFKEGALQAVLACRVFHFFSEDKILEGLKKIRSWLSGDGKLFIVNETPYFGTCRAFIPIYEERKRLGEPWLGLVDLNYFDPTKRPFVEGTVNLFDADTLTWVLNEAGFKIEKLSYINRTGVFPESALYDGRESIGAMTVKSD
ncbi:MAG: class I SAM-dependent methyltransferase [Alphaproteobacteria bacterium]|nr:class I SAM-dependent methyltransferase [Alphaproteobacteria bacterium]